MTDIKTMTEHEMIAVHETEHRTASWIAFKTAVKDNNTVLMEELFHRGTPAEKYSYLLLCATLLESHFTPEIMNTVLELDEGNGVIHNQLSGLMTCSSSSRELCLALLYQHLLTLKESIAKDRAAYECTRTLGLLSFTAGFVVGWCFNPSRM
jgi:hypothetical protein